MKRCLKIILLASLGCSGTVQPKAFHAPYKANLPIHTKFEGLKLYSVGQEYLKNVHNVQTENVPDGIPVKMDNNENVTSKFGLRKHPVYKTTKHHNGIDISAVVGTEVLATADGVVTETCCSSGYGNKIVIDHSNGISTLYAHLDSYDVRIGEYVSKGDVIGKSGNTGVSTGPHLHYEVRIEDKPVNPLLFYSYKELSNSQFTNILKNFKDGKDDYRLYSRRSN